MKSNDDVVVSCDCIIHLAGCKENSYSNVQLSQQLRKDLFLLQTHSDLSILVLISDNISKKEP